MFFKDCNLIDYSLLIGIYHGKPPNIKNLSGVWQTDSSVICLGIIDILTEYKGKKIL